MAPDRDLEKFGYRQESHRSLGGFSAFAAGFSFVSILTVFQLFGLGYSLGGTLFFWTWPVVIFGQLMVALNFAELAARFPLAGSLSGATNAVILGVLLIVFTTAANAAGVRIMARVNDIGVAAEIVGILVLIGGACCSSWSAAHRWCCRNPVRRRGAVHRERLAGGRTPRRPGPRTPGPVPQVAGVTVVGKNKY